MNWGIPKESIKKLQIVVPAMDATPKTRKSLFDGLARILHLHQLPRAEKKTEMVPEGNPWKNKTMASSAILRPRAPIPAVGTPTLSVTQPVAPASLSKPFTPTRPVSQPVRIPATPPTSASKPTPAIAVASRPPQPAPLPLSPVVSRTAIVTDYDRIYELVKTNQSIKLDGIARILALKEERVAQELQTLEDNGMVDVRYPAFGEPLIVYKKPEA
mgnify:CR=1 FL=1